MPDNTDKGACSACDGVDDLYFDHVHVVEALPDDDHSNAATFGQGYAVDIHGPKVPDMWVFFRDPEPALVFGRAGRMSAFQINGYAVFPAASEVRYVEQMGRDVRMLHVLDQPIDRQPDELKSFRGWIAGVDVQSSHFNPEKA